MMLIIFLFLALSQRVLALTIRIQIPASSLLQNPNSLPASTHATLTSPNGPPQRAILRKGNYIEFTDITTTGSHLLDIFSRDYVFAPFRIDVSPTTSEVTGAWETYRGTQWSDHGIALITAPTTHLTINAKVLSRKNFYEQRPGFNPTNLLKNPMILMGVVALAFTFGMPKLMENMDPELKAEYEEMQKKGPLSGMSKALQAGGSGSGGPGEGFDLAGFLAGSQTKSSGVSAGSGGGGANDIRERKR